MHVENIPAQDAWNQIRRCVFSIAGEIRYGKVEVTIHDAQIVQVEVTEKFRQPNDRSAGIATRPDSTSKNSPELSR
jgi:hypothetical protein